MLILFETNILFFGGNLLHQNATAVWPICKTVLLLHIHTGVINCANKLLVTLDILLEMRQHVMRGEPPSNYAAALIGSLVQFPDILMSEPNCTRYLQEKLYDCYYGFECMTDRDWNQGICGICGICPVFESGDGNCKNCIPIRGQVNK